MKIFCSLTPAIFSFVFATALHAEIKLPSIIGDGMVLQQKQANPIWGWDMPGTEVTVIFGSQTKTGKAGDDGKWTVTLDPLEASAEPVTMTFHGTGLKEAKDVLVGEVWLCSGQSNMGFPLNGVWNSDLEVALSDQPQIRLLRLPNVGSQELQNDFDGKWTACTKETAGNFSAVAYYYGRILQQTLKVPVGLIDNSFGGSAAEAWVKRDVLDKDGRFADYVNDWAALEKIYDHTKPLADYQAALKEWENKRDEATAASQPVPAKPEPPYNPMTGMQRPGNLYATCIYPILSYGIRGVIWYQGENNAPRAASYNNLMTLLIGEWRREWKQGDFPFYFVQLADFENENPEPVESQWAELREAQTLTLNTVENTGQAVTINLGEANNIHPRNKRDVAERLARWALAKDYGIPGITYRSPEFKTIAIHENKALVQFDHVGTGLSTFDVNELKGFAICGEDKKWFWANAQFVPSAHRDTIEISSPHVAKPVAVRYAWADNPVCNIVSMEGLPMTPFQSDRFAKSAP